MSVRISSQDHRAASFASRPRKPVHRLVVCQVEGGWCVEGPHMPSGRLFKTEWQALRAADELALQLYREGADTRVVTRGSDDRLDLVVSYGRHPDLD